MTLPITSLMSTQWCLGGSHVCERLLIYRQPASKLNLLINNIVKLLINNIVKLGCHVIFNLLKRNGHLEQ